MGYGRNWQAKLGGAAGTPCRSPVGFRVGRRSRQSRGFSRPSVCRSELASDIVTSELGRIKMDSDRFGLLFLIVAGLGLIYIGISGTLGYRRQAYILPQYYSGANYSSLPGGIACLLWAIPGLIPLPELWANTLGYMGLGFMLLGFLLIFIEPAFLTPHWYRWLEEHHGDIMPWLRQDVKRIGYRIWKRRTKTIPELDEWANEVRERYRREIEMFKRSQKR